MPEPRSATSLVDVTKRLVAVADAVNILDNARARQVEELQLRVSSLETRLEAAEDYARETREAWPEKFA